MKQPELVKIFVKEMERHSLGHACYHRVSSEKVQPGAVGYFDHLGEWTPIVNLRDLEPLAPKQTRGLAAKFTRLEANLDVTEQSGIRWPRPRTSASVTKVDTRIGVDVPVPVGVPLKAGLHSEYTNEAQYGCVFFAEGDITRRRATAGPHFEEWAAKNEATIRRHRPEVKDYGLWIVEGTYEAQKTWLNVWAGEGKKVSLYFSAGIDGAASLEAGGGFSVASASEGWVEYSAKTGEKIVCFVSGIRFRWKRHWHTIRKRREGVKYFVNPDKRFSTTRFQVAGRVGFDEDNTAAQGVEALNSAQDPDLSAVGSSQELLGEAKTISSEDEDDNSSVEIENLTWEEAWEQGWDHAVLQRGAEATRLEGKDDLSEVERQRLRALEEACEQGRDDVVARLLQDGVDPNDSDALISAADKGHTRILQLLFLAGADVNRHHSEGRYTHDKSNALYIASKNGHEAVLWLLAAGASANRIGGEYGNALQAAAAHGHDRVIRWLLAAGADVRDVRGSFGTALHAAASEGHADAVRQLISARADVNMASGPSGGDSTPLYEAAYNGHMRIIDILLGAGADINVQGGLLGYPLAAAAAADKPEVVRYLLSRGAEVYDAKGLFVNALSGAASRGLTEVFTILLSEAKKRPGSQFQKALPSAARGGHSNIVQLLLDSGANVNDVRDNYGFTPLMLAAEKGHLDTVRVLLGAGADANVVHSPEENLYITALYLATEKGRAELVKQLLTAGAEVDVGFGGRGTALHKACFIGDEELVQLLLDAGADISLHDYINHQPALHVASYFSRAGVVRQILARASLDQINEVAGFYGTALQAAAAEGADEVVGELISAGADVNARGGAYGTALRAAVKHGHDKIVDMLLAAGAVREEYGGG